jgi:solute:Na+ symporter, SSS family
LHPIDWIIVVGYIAWLVWDGVKRTKLERTTESYFLASRSLPWWAVGLSVMATQLSAITLVGTTGQGFNDGLRFIQFYIGLPIAMLVLSVTLVPFFYKARVYTAYEYLEKRFDLKTRTLTSLLFLLSRGMSCGAVVAAPAVVLSVILGWDVTLTALAICVPAVVYTILGGVQAVTWTDVKVMGLTVFVLVAAVVVLIVELPADTTTADALRLAGAVGRLDAFDFRFSLTETYTIWSGLIGGLFLMLSYFGCDQSQVQRYLTARSLDQARSSLFMTAYWKIPLQILVLIVGVLTYAFYVFHRPPMLFNPVHERTVKQSAQAPQYAALEKDFQRAFDGRVEAAEAVADAERSGDRARVALAASTFRERENEVRRITNRARDMTREAAHDVSYSDVNYVFPTFITTVLPIGLVGLWIVAIITAATDTIAAELNSLATATVIDFYQRHYRPNASDAESLRVSKFATAAWGGFACIVAVYASSLGSLIEVVNRFGSFFYGSILGVFLLATLTRGTTGTGAFIGLLTGMATVAAVAAGRPDISFLWHNVIGASVVVLVGLAYRPQRAPHLTPNR